MAGNYITIKHDNEEFSFYAHLKKNSIKVRKGDVVKKGQHIANCGNSGNSTEPHLHFQVMNRRNFFFGRSLKIKFEKAITQTKKEVEFIEKEMIVENRKTATNKRYK
ncbi:M23 family metallopeptidase [Flavobacteriaceae bacterium]|nr:M23 family metallopeptidase [Flavobacteriaceae bacterium]MDC0385857.1 M23 family metallopeptidase [Flavobacteriaceae bacterium]